MNCINELIKLGFSFSVNNGQIAYEFKGNNSPQLEKIKPLIEEMKRNKPEVIRYIQSLIIYEIPDGLNFDFQVQACLQSAYNNDIEWLRTDVYKNSRKVVLTGVVKKPKILSMWHEASKESNYYRDCPWTEGRLVQ